MEVLERETVSSLQKNSKVVSRLTLPQVSLGRELSMPSCCIFILTINTYVVHLSLSKSLNLPGPPFSNVLMIMKPLITVFQNTSHTFPFDHHNNPVRYAWQILLSSFYWPGNWNSEVKWLAQGHKTNKCLIPSLWFRILSIALANKYFYMCL